MRAVTLTKTMALIQVSPIFVRKRGSRVLYRRFDNIIIDNSSIMNALKMELATLMQ